ncbi:MAG: DUF1080 domain-containing protein [Marinilabiliaceae bacterium]|jgi:hypothetical protein|nr:DUF1080 domain-containing protein [Marinilabiliaceae bacterium]
MNKLLVILISLVLVSCRGGSKVEKNSAAITEGENWESIFNGEDLSGWTPKISGYPYGENYKNTFIAEDGVIKANYSEYETFEGEFGHLFYERSLSSYKLRLKYRFTGEQVKDGPGWAFRNNGAMLHCQDPATMGIDQDFPVSIEAQFLGGDGETPRTTLNLCTPGTNVVINNELLTQHCINSTSETFHGDQWVSAEMVVYADSLIHHIVNGDTVLTYTKPQIGGGSIPEGFPLPDGTALASGYIALQAESHPCEFKDIEIMVLK